MSNAPCRHCGRDRWWHIDRRSSCCNYEPDIASTEMGQAQQYADRILRFAAGVPCLHDLLGEENDGDDGCECFGCAGRKYVELAARSHPGEQTAPASDGCTEDCEVDDYGFCKHAGPIAASSSGADAEAPDQNIERAILFEAATWLDRCAGNTTNPGTVASFDEMAAAVRRAARSHSSPAPAAAPSSAGELTDAIEFVGEAVAEAVAESRKSGKSKDHVWADGVESAWQTLRSELARLRAGDAGQGAPVDEEALYSESGCKAGRDGDCVWKECPQNRDGEPMKSGRHCPRDWTPNPDDADGRSTTQTREGLIAFNRKQAARARTEPHQAPPAAPCSDGCGRPAATTRIGVAGKVFDLCEAHAASWDHISAMHAPPAASVPGAARSPIPAQTSPEQERDVDELLEDFQRACERCVSHLASDEGYARTDAKNRAILRNELRSRLLSVVSPPADTGKET